MNWPAESPNLNPLKNLWDYVEVQVQDTGGILTGLTGCNQVLGKK